MYLRDQTLAIFLVATCLLRFSFSLVLPFLLNTITVLDHSSRLVISIFLVMAIGGTAGPAIAATLVRNAEGYGRIVVFALLAIAISTCLLMLVMIKAQQVSMKNKEPNFSKD